MFNKIHLLWKGTIEIPADKTNTDKTLKLKLSDEDPVIEIKF